MGQILYRNVRGPGVPKGYAMAGIRRSSAPTPPAGASFASIAHPAYCASDAAHVVPCVEGSAVRWWKDAVTGTWYEQATIGKRFTFRELGGGKYAVEGAGGQEHTFTVPTWVGTSGIMTAGQKRTTSGSAMIAADLMGGDEYAPFVDSNVYALNFRTARADAIAAYPANTNWHTYSESSGAAYEVHIDGSLSGTVAASWATPDRLIVGANNVPFYSDGLFTAVLVGFDPADRAAFEAFVASLAP